MKAIAENEKRKEKKRKEEKRRTKTGRRGNRNNLGRE